jgi:hypothetical protein
MDIGCRQFVGGVLLLLGATWNAIAAPPFELDGNATANDFPGDDWSVVNFGPGGSLARTGLIVDRPEPAFAQFTGGGSKDEQDITNWKHRGGAPPAKDDITNAYAAAYTNPDKGNQVLIFGMDRFDTSGDAQLGFWFLQDDVQAVAPDDFDGVHQDGDILVLVNFSGGGDVPTIQVFQWQGAGPVSLGVGDDVLCTGGWLPTGEDHCGITNATGVAAPWAYQNKDVGNTSTFPPAAFFEGAIDLTALGLDVCIQQFMAESRSSTSITAVLKDFVLPTGGFAVCNITVTKACANPRLNAAQTHIIYDISGSVTPNGGTVYNVSLSDNPAADGAFKRVTCGTTTQIGTFPVTSLDNGVQACYLNTMTVPLNQNGLSDTVTATANTEADGSGVALTDADTATCPNLTVSPALQVTKDCEASVEVLGGQVVAKVTVSGTVCNVGDTNLSQVTVFDQNITTSPDPLLSGVSLTTTAPNNCANYSGTYYPSDADDSAGEPTTNPGEVVFKDTVEAQAVDIFNNSVTPATDMADCPLCPPHEP